MVQKMGGHLPEECQQHGLGSSMLLGCGDTGSKPWAQSSGHRVLGWGRGGPAPGTGYPYGTCVSP